MIIVENISFSHSLLNEMNIINFLIEYTLLKYKDMEPVQAVQLNIYRSNACRNDLSWLHFDDEQRLQERQQVKDEQSFISLFVPYPTISSSS